MASRSATGAATAAWTRLIYGNSLLVSQFACRLPGRTRDAPWDDRELVAAIPDREGVMSLPTESPSYPPVHCPYCAERARIPEASFKLWGAQTVFVTASCPNCRATVTFPTRPDGTVNGEADALGNGRHGATRAERELEGLGSRAGMSDRASLGTVRRPALQTAPALDGVTRVRSRSRGRGWLAALRRATPWSG